VFGERLSGWVIAVVVGDLRVVDSAFQFIDDNLVLFEVCVMVAFVADAMVFVGCEIRT
jgi:hypothetical protein